MTLAEIVDECSDYFDQMVETPYEFYYNFIALSYNDESEAPHIQKLSDELERIYYDEIDSLCVAMPPRHSKSSMLTLAFPLWLIFQDPDLDILIVNAESTLSENFGIRLREYVKYYGPLFDVYLSDVKHSSTHLKFEDSKGNLYKGSIRLTGSNGSITGQDCDYLILDDIYKGFSDITPTLLVKKIEWFKTMILQRKTPSTKLLILHTRWHTNDLQGFLKENYPDKYTFLSFSAINEDGTPLWKERYTIDFLKDQLRQMGERLFSSIFQQKPLDETGDFFNLNDITFIDSFNHHTEYVAATVRSWDLAYSDATRGIKNDSTAGILMHKINDDTYVINDLVYGQFGKDLKGTLKMTAENDTPNIPILIETGTVGGAAEYLYDEYAGDLTGYNTEQSEPKGSKVDRATPFKEAILDHKIYIAISNDELRGKLIEQLKSFPLGTHDDIIDACAYAYNYLKGKSDAKDIYKTGKKGYRRR